MSYASALCRAEADVKLQQLAGGQLREVHIALCPAAGSPGASSGFGRAFLRDTLQVRGPRAFLGL